MNRKLKISLYLAAIFVAGLVSGVFISYLVVRHMMPSPDKIASRWCGELESKLKLNAEQMQRIRPIVDKALMDFEINVSHEMLSSLSNCNAQIAVGLTPSQKTTLDQLQRDQESFIRTEFGPEQPKAGR